MTRALVTTMTCDLDDLAQGKMKSLKFRQFRQFRLLNQTWVQLGSAFSCVFQWNLMKSNLPDQRFSFVEIILSGHLSRRWRELRMRPRRWRKWTRVTRDIHSGHRGHPVPGIQTGRFVTSGSASWRHASETTDLPSAGMKKDWRLHLHPYRR